MTEAVINTMKQDIVHMFVAYVENVLLLLNRSDRKNGFPYIGAIGQRLKTLKANFEKYVF